jgi:hypothetical protein
MIIIIVTVTKSYSVYIKYYSKQGEKIMVLVRIPLYECIPNHFKPRRGGTSRIDNYATICTIFYIYSYLLITHLFILY